MIKKEMIAMLLAGGQGSRLGVLTEKVAKPAVAFGGKYRMTAMKAVSQSFLRMRRAQAVNGTQELPMRSIRIWLIWSSITRIMY